MINLIKSLIPTEHRKFSCGIGTGMKHDMPYNEICDQIIGFLVYGVREYSFDWFRVLIGALDQQTKVKLVDSILTIASDLVDTKHAEILIKAAMEMIYPRQVFDRIHTETKSEKEFGYHDYIPFSHRNFARIISHWSKSPRKGINFIDVGCGISDKLVLARWFINRIKTTTGVEINTHTYHLGKFFIGNLYKEFPIPLEVIEGDAFDIDYGEYNLIYMYQPIALPERMFELYNHILGTMPLYGVMIEVAPPGNMPDLLGDETKFKVEDKTHALVVRKIA